MLPTSETTTTATTVILDSSSAIRPSRPIGLYVLFIGSILILYTPAWLILLSYQEDNDDNTCDVNTNGIENCELYQQQISISSLSSYDKQFLISIFSYLILDFIPWFANAGLSIFFGGLFIYLGIANIRSGGSTNDER